METNIYRNSIITPDGTVLVSEHRHDYVCHQDENGNKYCVDGGNAYLRRVAINNDYVENSITSSSSIEQIREVFTWGTYGKSGNKERVVKPIKDLSNEHIKAIIKTQKQLSETTISDLRKELKYRKEFGILIND